MRLARFALTAVLVTSTAIGAASLRGGEPAATVRTRAYQHPHASRHTVPVTLDGLNETLTAAGTYGQELVAAELARRAQEAAAAAARDSERRRTTSATSGTTRRPGGVNWDGIAQCETGGNWQHQTRFDGGLGIYHGAWLDFGGRDFAEYGSQATREQQIIVAERIYARYGLSGWGCKAYG